MVVSKESELALQALRSAWAAAEADIESLGYPGDVWVEGQIGERTISLGFIRDAKLRRICFDEANDSGEWGEWRPVVDCNSIDRAASVDLFPALRSEVARLAGTFPAVIQEAADRLMAMIGNR